MAGGRPSIYSEELAESICERMRQGESLLSICCDDAMPDRSTVYKWIREREEFSDNYTQAREALADVWFEEVVGLADKGSYDVQRDRLRVDSRKWAASRMAPRKYGDRFNAQISGDPDGVPVTFRWEGEGDGG